MAPLSVNDIHNYVLLFYYCHQAIGINIMLYIAMLDDMIIELVHCHTFVEKYLVA